MPTQAEINKKIDDAILRGIRFMEKAMHEDGSYGVEMPSRDGGKPVYMDNVGITGLALLAILESPCAKDEVNKPYFQKGVKYLLSKVQKDGSITNPETGYYIYKTGICIRVFALLDSDRYARIIKDGQEFLRNIQYDETDQMTEEDDFYGGWGYGQKMGRPALPPADTAIEGLRESGLKADDPVFKKAKVFVKKCQNTDENVYDKKHTKEVDPIHDGGARHNPRGSKVESTSKVKGKINMPSSGSMTAAFIKSMLYMGEPKDSDCLRQAFNWIVKNYTLERNPGFTHKNNKDKQGLYYYYNTLSKALLMYGAHIIITPDDKHHNWAVELSEKIISLQREDGSWFNQYEERWYEGNPSLVTSYCVMALSNCRREMLEQQSVVLNAKVERFNAERLLENVEMKAAVGKIGKEEADKIRKDLEKKIGRLTRRIELIEATLIFG